MRLAEIFNNQNLNLTLFSDSYKQELESHITEKTTKGGKVKYRIVCHVRGIEIDLTPEEVVRQLYLMKLTKEYGYPVSRIKLEYGVTFGRETKRADIVILDKDRTDSPYIIVECKKSNLKEGKDQLKSYCNGTGAPIGVWTNGNQIQHYHRKDPNYFEDLTALPNANQSLSDILEERWKIDDLIKHDKLVTERRSLKDLIHELEDEILAGAGVDVFEEVFKLIFTKLYDEKASGRDRNRNLEFRNYGYTDSELMSKIQGLFDSAKQKWEGIFSEDSKIELTPSHLSVCIASLQDVKLFNSNLEVIDDAFEYLMNKSQKGEKGQYFTPRYVIDMCVKMLNPQKEEKIIDPAAGSCGFPLHTIFHVWKNILTEKGLPHSHLFTLEEKPTECIDYVDNNVFAIDFDEKTVRVARTLNIIAGDGHTNALYLNSLDYERWESDFVTGKSGWIDTYNEGWKKLKKLRVTKNENREFAFDIVMANPPFAGDINESRILAKYELASNVTYSKLKNAPSGAKIDEWGVFGPSFPDAVSSSTMIYKMPDGTFKKKKIAQSNKMSRDILFIERNLDMLKPGGRMAIVLPQGRFNNDSDKYVREYIASRCRILAVVGLHSYVFKPHTTTKTSVLIVQKWDDELCPRKEDYNIFFATMQEPSKDNSGDKIYRSTTNADGVVVPLLDSHGHLIVKHDLFNHDGLTSDGIVEAFIEFAKKEQLSFFHGSPFNELKYKSLLGGLKICEVSFRDLILNSEIMRIEAEYYNSDRLHYPQMISGKQSIVFSQYGTSEELNDINLGYPILRLNEYESAFIGKPAKCCNVIDKDTFESLLLKKNDVLICRTNGNPKYVGKAAIVPKDYNYAFASYLFRVRPNIIFINSATLVAFLNCKYGRIEIERLSMQSNQANFSPAKYREISIPVLPKALCSTIEQKTYESFDLLDESRKCFNEAIRLFREYIDLPSGYSDYSSIVEIPFKKAYFVSGRIDAEYYQQKYTEIERLIKTKCTEVWYLKDSMIQDGNISPATRQLYKYIELSNIGGSCEIKGCTEDYGENLPSRAKRVVKTNDVLVSYLEGSLSSCTLVPDEYNNSFCSNGFYVLRDTPLQPEVLLIVFTSKVIQELLHKGCSGHIMPSISKEELQKIPLPSIPEDLQQRIAALVKRSFELRRQSNSIIEETKRMIEYEIENPSNR